MNDALFLTKEMDDSWMNECFSELCVPYTKEDPEYQALIKEWDEISEKYPKVNGLLDFEKAVNLSAEEAKAVYRLFEIQEAMHYLEQKALAIAVQNQMLGLFLQFGERKK